MKKIRKTMVTLMVFGCLCLFGTSKADAASMQITTAKVPTISNIAQLNNVSACYSHPTVVNKDKNEQSYAKFTLTQDSWVTFGASYSLCENDYGSTHISIYRDAAFSNQAGEYGYGYWEYTREYSAFLTKGTYYVSMLTKLGNGSEFKGNVNMIAAAIPVSKIFTITSKTASNKSYATVRMTDILGSRVKMVEYRPGAVSLANVNNNNYWNYLASGILFGGDNKVKQLTLSGSQYKFKAVKNGSYTIMLQDTSGNRYSKVVKVSGIDKTKPSVKGVKNNKIYKKKVTIKFSDKGSGIKKASLNGKTIKSGKKVSKKGSYKLVVTDKAGNKTTIKFKIKKK